MKREGFLDLALAAGRWLGLSLYQRTTLAGLIPAPWLLVVNDLLVRNRRQRIAPREILILLPKCLPDKIQNQFHMVAWERGISCYTVEELEEAQELIDRLQPEALLAMACLPKLATGMQRVNPRMQVMVIPLPRRDCTGCKQPPAVTEIIGKIDGLMGG